MSGIVRALSVPSTMVWLALVASPFVQAHDDGTDHLDGIMDVIQIDYTNGTSRTEYFVIDDRNKKRVPIQFKPGAKKEKLLSGQRVIVRGKAKGRPLPNTATVGDAGVDAESIEIVSAASTTAVTSVARRAVALIVNMQNANSVDPNPATVSNRLYFDTNSVKNFWEDSSHQQLTLQPDSNGDGASDVFGPYSIPFDGTQSCDYNTWANAADQAAQNSGVNLSLYQHRIYILPASANLQCSWAGLANVGCGTYCRSWMASASNRVYAHELGHNFSFHHAATDWNNDNIIDSEYGDRSDVMGSTYSALNAPNRFLKGWLNAFNGATVQVSSSGSYLLAPLDDNPDLHAGTPQVLILPKADTNQRYFVSYRTVGKFPASSEYRYRVSVHKSGYSVSGKSMAVAILNAGERFTDAANGITVIANAVSGGTASVTVDMNCSGRSAPLVQMTPAETLMAPGTQQAFTLTLSNPDSAACGTGNYSISQSLPAGFSANLSTTSLQVPAGGSATMSWTLNAGNTLSSGTYSPSLNITLDSAQPPQKSTATVRIDATAPTAPTGLTATLGRKGAVALAWKASVDAESGVKTYRILRNGSVIGESTGTSFSDNRTLAGSTYSYTIVAVNGVGLVSASSNSVTLTFEGGSKGGKPSR